jgi:hypothetical protein
MMNLVKDIGAGIAASALFGAIDYFLLSLPPFLRVAGLAVTFGIAVIVAKRFSRSSQAVKILSETKTGGTLDASIKDIDVEGGSDTSIGSNNDSSGDMNISIEGVRIKK